MTIHRFYAPVAAFREGQVLLAESETHHLRDVLRHAVGDEVNVFDGSGGEFRCRVEAIAKRSAELMVLEPIEAMAESPLRLTLAAALLKGDKFDLVVKKCVELGVAAIVPLITDRCDVRLTDAGKRVERWEKLVIDATRQCGRSTLTSVKEPSEFGSFVRIECPGRSILFAERLGSTFDQVRPTSDIIAIIGPEGGWSDCELALAKERRVNIVTLGGRILRAETASIAIAAILQHRFGDFN